MAKRPEAGRIFLRDVIDTEPKSHVDEVDIRNFQAFYAASLRSPAFILETGSEALLRAGPQEWSLLRWPQFGINGANWHVHVKK